MINIALSGACGKMCRVISGLVNERSDCKIIAGIDVFGEKYADFEIYKSFNDLPVKPDVIIDYSHPSALGNLLNYGKINNVPLVIATTGYSDEERNIITSASSQIPIFFTFNMSLGINLLVELARKATQILGGQFDIEIVEKHHNLKQDAPSGTAVMIAEAINDELNNNYRFVYDRHNVRKARDKDEIGLHAIRGGTIVGEHDIIFAGHDEIITLSHSAQSKEVFAVGSLNAALFLADKTAALYNMADLIKN